MMTLTETTVVERSMSTVEPPPPQQAVYLPPQSTVQLAHATSDAVITGLAKSPYLLGVVVIVLVGVGAAIYFLQILITGQAFHLNNLLQQQTRQQSELLAMHKQEFEALLEMSNRLSPVPQPPNALNSPVFTQPPQPPRR